MYGTVADAALIEAAQRIAPLVRACRDEGERERRLPAQVLAAMHEARLFRMYIEGAGWPRNRPDHVDDCRRGDRPCRRRGGAEFDARRHLRSVGGLLARGSRARDLRRHAVVAGALRPSGRARPVDGGFVVDGRWSDARTATWQHRFRSSRRMLIRGMRRRNFTDRHAASGQNLTFGTLA